MVRNSERGNVFFTLFGAVAVVGVLGAAIMATMRGPLTSMVEVQRRTQAEAEMSIAAKLVLLEATEQADDGDCDSDGFVEPLEYLDTAPQPTGGGQLPTTVGSNKEDPWGVAYGYCAWDAGPTVQAVACGGATQNRLDGTEDTDETYTVIAIVSAGADKTFQTTCTGGASPEVTKTAGSDDFWSLYNYQDATVATGGLWNIKSGDPSVAQIGKDLEVTGGATFSDPLDLTGASAQLRLGAASLTLPTQAELITCDNGNNLLLRVNTTLTPPTVQICDGPNNAWESATEGANLWQQNGTEIYYDTNFVGIGLNDPTVELDVDGDFKLTGDADIGGDILMANTKSVVWASGADITEASGALEINANGGTGVELDVDANAVTMIADLDITGSTADNSAAALDVKDSAAAPLLYVGNDGNIGIATSSPANTLQLGTIATGQPDRRLVITGYAAPELEFNAHNNWSKVVLSAGHPGVLTLRNDGNNKTTVDFSLIDGSVIFPSAGGSTRGVWMRGTGSQRTGGGIYTGSGAQGGLVFRSYFSPYGVTDYKEAVFTKDGFLGIGVASPNDALDVDGDAEVTGSITAGSTIIAGGTVTAGVTTHGDNAFLINDGSTSVVFGPATECTSAQKLDWDDSSGWSCIDDIGATGTSGGQTIAEVLNNGADAGGRNIEDLGNAGADQYCRADMTDCTDSADLRDANKIDGEDIKTTISTDTDTDGEVLYWSQTNTQWEAGTLASIGVNDLALDTSVTSASCANGYVPISNGTNDWVCGDASSIGGTPAVAIDDLTDAAHSGTNLFLGHDGGSFGASDGTNIGIGSTALDALNDSNADGNIALGYQALTSLASGNTNVAIGANALQDSVSSTNAVAIGNFAGQNSEVSSNVYIGPYAGRGDATLGLTGGQSVYIGANAGQNVSTGQRNTFIGYGAGDATTTGSQNTAIGRNALGVNTLGGNNTAIGNQALRVNTEGTSNIAIGSSALYSNTLGNSNIVFGSAAGSNTEGTGNIVAGYLALRYNQIGNNNLAFGTEAGQGASAGASDVSLNIIMGHRAGRVIETGADGNILLGFRAGNSITTGAKNIIIGYNADTTGAVTDDEYLNIGNALFGDMGNTASTVDGGADFTIDGDLTVTGTLSGSGTSSALDDIAAADGANTIASGDNAQVWNWQVTTDSKSAMTFGESLASTGAGTSIVKTGTLASSTAIPLYVENLGDGASFRVDDASGDTSPFIIDAAGQVGIGTTSPSATLDVQGGDITLEAEYDLHLGTPPTGFENYDFTVNSEYGGIILNRNRVGYESFILLMNDDSNANGGQMRGLVGGGLRFIQGSSISTGEVFRITSSSYMGIGTSGPDRRLDVLDASNPQLRLTRTDGSIYTDFQTDASGYLSINTSGGKVALSDYGGGTVTGTAAYLMAVEADGDLIEYNLASVVNDNIAEGDSSIEIVDTGDGYITFTEDGAEEMRLTGGELGIGTDTPLGGLDVRDNIYVGLTSAVGDEASLNTADGRVITTPSGILLYKSGDGTGTTGGWLNLGNLFLSGRDRGSEVPILISKHGTASDIVNINSASDVGGDLFKIDSSGNVSIGTESPEASAILSATSTSKGFLPPRMTTAQVAAISSPANGLLVYDSDVGRYKAYQGGSWQEILTSATGNITDDSLDFDKFTDTMALDASTSITADGTEVLSIVNTGTGNTLLVEDEASDTTPFVIDADGNVGIGTTSPSELLDVDGYIKVANATGGIKVRDAADSSTATVLRMDGNDDIIFGDTSGASDRLVFFTNGNRVVDITEAGRVGVGFSSPDRTLDVLDASNPQLRLTHTDGSVYTDFQTDASGYLSINTSGDKITLSDYGAGSSVATPAYLMGVEADGDLVEYSVASVLSGVSADKITEGDTEVEVVDAGDGYITMTEDGTERVRISDGNLGVGTSSPVSKLHVYKGSAGGSAAPSGTYDTGWIESNNINYFHLVSPSDKRSGLIFTDTARFGGGYGAIMYSHDDTQYSSVTQSMHFFANSNIMMTLTGFRLGVGTREPATRFEVQHTGFVKGNTDFVSITNDQNAADMDATETSVVFNQYYYDATTPAVATAARITAGTETDWTSTAGTQDSYLAFATVSGGSAAEAMRIDSDGNVGIGTASPSVRLTVDGTTTGPVAEFILDDNATKDRQIALSLWNKDGLDNDQTSIQFYHDNGKEVSSSIVNDQNNTGSSKLNLIGVSDGTGTGNARLVIDGGNGSVIVNDGNDRGGIFTVFMGDSNEYMLIARDSGRNQLKWYDSGSHYFSIEHASGSNTLYFTNEITGTEVMTIEATGNVGIGTTSPDALLDVEGGSVRFTDYGTGTYEATPAYLMGVEADGDLVEYSVASVLSGVSIADDSLDFDKFTDTMALDASTSITADGTEVLSIVNTGTGNSFLVEDQASDTSPFVIDAAGQVGIGRSTPGEKLDVNGSIVLMGNNPLKWYYGGTAYDVVNLNGTGRTEIKGPLNNSSDIHFITRTSNSDVIRMFIKNNGNVGIGTTSPSAHLDLEDAGTAKANVDVLEITNSRNATDMDATETSVVFNQYYYDATTPAVATAARITAGTETDWTSTAGTQDSYLAFATVSGGSAAEAMRIDSAGNVGIGTASPTVRLTVDGTTTGPVAEFILDDNDTQDLQIGLSIWNKDARDNDRTSIQFYQDDGKEVSSSIVNGQDNTSYSTLTLNSVSDSSGTVGGYLTVRGNDSSVVVNDYNSRGGIFTVAMGSNEYMMIDRGDSGRNQLKWWNTATGDLFSIEHNDAANTMYFSNETTNTEVMTIEATGNVGIGTTSPDALLDVEGGSVRFTDYGTGTYEATPAYLMGVEADGDIVEYSVASVLAAGGGGASDNITEGDTEVEVVDAGDGYITMTEDGTEYMRLTGGNLRVLTGGKVRFMEATNTTKGGPLVFHNSGSHQASWRLDTSNTLHVDMEGKAETMSITTAGNVGIGTTSPDGKLHVMRNAVSSGAAAFNSTLTVEHTDSHGINIITNTDRGGRIYFSDTTAGQGTIEYQHNGDYMRFDTDNDERMRIDSTGQIGIGTTAPSSKLDIEDTGTAKANTDILEITNAGNAADMDATETSVVFNQYYYDATTPAVATAARITAGTETDWTSTAGTQDSYLAFATVSGGSAAEAMRIDSDGNVGIGTTSPSAVLNVAGNALFEGNNNELTFNTSTFNISRVSANNRLHLNSDGNVIIFEGSTTEVARLTGSRFGVGTGDPDRKLDVRDASDPQLRLTHTDGSVYTDLQTDASGYLSIDTSGDKITLSDYGSGSSVATPAYLMGVEADGDLVEYSVASVLSGVSIADDSLDFDKFTDTMALDASTSITADGTEVLSIVNTGTGNSFLVEDQASDTSPFVIDAAGQVGIGRSTPGEKLDVNGSIVLMGNNPLKWYYGGTAYDVVNFSGSAQTQIKAPLNNSSGIYFITRTSNTDVNRMFIKNNGNVGIGTTSPSAHLDLEDAGTAKANVDVLEITNSRNATDMDATETSVVFNQYYYDATTPAVATAARITAGTETDWTSTAGTQDSYLAFATVSGGSAAEAMRIDSDGNVGIGMTSPSQTLSVTGDVGIWGDKLSIQQADASSPAIRLYKHDNTSVYWDMRTNNDTDLILGSTGAANFLFLDYGGRLGLGTTSPDRTFDVLHASNPQMRLTHTDGTVYTDFQTDASGYLSIDTSGGKVTLSDYGAGSVVATPAYLMGVEADGDVVEYSVASVLAAGGGGASDNITEGDTVVEVVDAGDGYITFTEDGTEYMRLTGGELGIGTTAPGYDLHIKKSASSVKATIENQANNTAYLHIGHDTSGSSQWATMGFAGTSDILEIKNSGGGGTHLAIDTGGQVGIGTTSPSSKLHVSGGDLRVVHSEDDPMVLVGDDLTASGYGTLQWDSTGNYLELTHGSTEVLSIKKAGSVYYAQAPRFYAIDGSSDPVVLIGESTSSGAHGYAKWNSTDDTIQIGTSTGGDTITVNENTDVGIGTATASAKVDIQDTGTAKANTDILEITNAGNAADMDATETSIVFNQYYYDATTPAVADAARITAGTETDWTSTAGTQDSYLAFATVSGGSAAEAMRIDSDGNVGIGTTSPDTSLHVSNGIIKQTGSGGSVQFWHGTTFGLVGTISNTAFSIRTNDTDRVRVTSSGSVGIGTTGPDRILDIRDASNPQLRLTQTDATNYTDFQTDSNGYLAINTSGGKITLSDYGAGSVVATPAYLMGVEADGDVVEYSVASVLAAGGGASSLDDLSDATNNTTTYNIFLGATSGSAGATDNGNIAIGQFMLDNLNNSGADNNTVIGYNALTDLQTGDNNTVMGYRVAGEVTGSQNTAMGEDALLGVNASSAVNGNVAVGYQAGKAVLTGGDYNTFLGYYAGDGVTTGTRNIVVGYGADTSGPTSDDYLNIGNAIYGDMGTSTASGTGDAAITVDGDLTVTDMTITGTCTGCGGSLDDLSDATNNTTDYNIFLGATSGSAGATDNGNIAIGQFMLDNLNNSGADNNTVIGYNALTDLQSGDNNTVVGYGVASEVTGSGNTALGDNALRGVNASSAVNGNVAIGYLAGEEILTGGDYNVYIGYRTGQTMTTGSENILIGNGVAASANTDSNFLNIGNTIYGTMGGSTAGMGTGDASLQIDGRMTVVHSSDTPVVAIEDANGSCYLNPGAGASWSCSSDRRLKENIVPAPPVLDELDQFQIKEFDMKAGGHFTGVIAQEVQEIQPDMVEMSESGYLRVEQPNLWKLVKAIQELREENRALRAELDDVSSGDMSPAMRGAIASLTRQVEELRTRQDAASAPVSAAPALASWSPQQTLLVMILGFSLMSVMLMLAFVIGQRSAQRPR